MQIVDGSGQQCGTVTRCKVYGRWIWIHIAICRCFWRSFFRFCMSEWLSIIQIKPIFFIIRWIFTNWAELRFFLNFRYGLDRFGSLIPFSIQCLASTSISWSTIVEWIIAHIAFTSSDRFSYAFVGSARRSVSTAGAQIWVASFTEYTEYRWFFDFLLWCIAHTSTQRLRRRFSAIRQRVKTSI